MRIFWMALLTCTITLLGGGCTGEPPRKKTIGFPDRKGEVDNGNGNISWKSSVTEHFDGTFTYHRSVTNRSGDMNCRVTWKFGNVSNSSTIPPQKTYVLFEGNYDISPTEVRGTITYNGGKDVGEAKADAPVWTQKATLGTKSKSSSCDAVVGFEFGKKTVELAIKSETKVVSFQLESEITYKLEIKPPLPAEVKVRWTSILSEPFKEQAPGSVYNDSEKTIQFENDNKSSVFSTTIKIPALQPVFVDGTVQILTLDGIILAEASVPSLGPKK